MVTRELPLDEGRPPKEVRRLPHKRDRGSGLGQHAEVQRHVRHLARGMVYGLWSMAHGLFMMFFFKYFRV